MYEEGIVSRESLISIHAPIQGAINLQPYVTVIRWISIHARIQGAIYMFI